MFSKISRYREEDDVGTVDAAGRTRVSKQLRLLPVVDGQFAHTLADGDRIDQLAFKYYKQPRKWWRICDANPEFMSPQSLLGKDVLETVRFPVRFAGVPDWASLLAALEARVGVEQVRLEEEWSVAQEQQISGGQEVTVDVERIAHWLRVTLNRLNLGIAAIVTVIEGAGFEVYEEPFAIGRVGKPITIPPDSGTRA